MKHLILLLALLVVAGCEGMPIGFHYVAPIPIGSSEWHRFGVRENEGGLLYDKWISFHVTEEQARFECDRLNGITPRWTFNHTAIYRPDGTVVYTFADSLEFAGLVAQMEEWGGP